MWFSRRRLNKALKEAEILKIDDDSKIVFMSDAHRGDGGFSDDAVKNRNIMSHALGSYFKEGFTYIELGDGNELWENIYFKTVYRAHKNTFLRIKDFYDDNRLFMIWGNHDMVYRNPKTVKRHFSEMLDAKTDKMVDFMPNLKYHEALRIQYKDRQVPLLALHGHQADFMNYSMWKFNRFFVRLIWKWLQSFGFYDPTSPAQNHIELIRVERRIKKWIHESKTMVIAGHTHRPRFPSPNETPFFNDGSGVHPRSVTAIEIQYGYISLVKWHIITDDMGYLKIEKETLEGPMCLEDYWAAFEA
ncbi:MAG: metallophosphoesterase [Flavobacteriales bacterium]|jgi:UDP-2,3-diacylglucosamine pyrophosphatase LpxH|nr:metallophosphoesterase [Flavobacteriales bacterium]